MKPLAISLILAALATVGCHRNRHIPANYSDYCQPYDIDLGDTWQHVVPKKMADGKCPLPETRYSVPEE